MIQGAESNRTPIPTWFFVVVVVRKDDRFLVVHESKGEQKWYLPAGRVELGESFSDAAWRETMEEAGVATELDGVIRVEQLPMKQGMRVRVFFTARPVDDTPPRSDPNTESLGAKWAAIPEIAEMPLRDPEVLEVCGYLATGGTVAPIGILTQEGASFL